MNWLPRAWRCWPLVLLALATGARADDYSFDASKYEKKPFEINGYVQLKAEDFSLNRDGAFYKLGYLGEPQREDLGRTSETMDLSGKLRQGIGTFDFHTTPICSRTSSPTTVSTRSTRPRIRCGPAPA